jgi:hypothetical protein
MRGKTITTTAIMRSFIMAAAAVNIWAAASTVVAAAATVVVAAAMAAVAAAVTVVVAAGTAEETERCGAGSRYDPAPLFRFS